MCTKNPDIVLASASPRRGELLEQIGVNYKVYAVDINESVLEGEIATDYVLRLALEKAQKGYRETQAEFVTLGSDTCIELNGEILGKPADASHATEILRKLSNTAHTVHTAVAVVHAQGENAVISTSKVYFARLEQIDIDAYIATGEPLDKAGAYAIQGIAAQFITKLEGSYSSVMGLPLYETSMLLKQCGINTLQLLNRI